MNEDNELNAQTFSSLAIAFPLFLSLYFYPAFPIDLILELIMKLRKNYIKFQNVNTGTPLQFNALESAPSCFEKDTLDVIKRRFEEISGFYENQDYRSTVINCGQMVEILIKNVYKILTKDEIYTKDNKGNKKERTVREMLIHLHNKSTILSRGLGEMVALIYAYRSGALHEQFWEPSRDEAHGIALLTNGAMNRIFEYFNTHPQS